MTKKIPKTSVEQTKGSGRLNPYLYPIGVLTQKNFNKSFHVCSNQKSFLTNNELKVN